MQVSDPVSEFSKRNSIRGTFVLACIQSASQLKKDNNSMREDPTMILYKVCTDEKEAITKAIDEQMQIDPTLAKEYSRPATPQDFTSIPLHIKNRFAGDATQLKMSQWKIRDLVINTTFIKWLDAVCESLTPIKIIEMVLQEFGKQINDLSLEEIKPAGTNADGQSLINFSLCK